MVYVLVLSEEVYKLLHRSMLSSKSKIIQEKIKEWEELGLTIWYLPAYSTHLNLIETLWRKIKHEGLKPYDFADKETFKNAIEDILENVGNVYKFSLKKETFI